MGTESVSCPTAPPPAGQEPRIPQDGKDWDAAAELHSGVLGYDHSPVAVKEVSPVPANGHSQETFSRCSLSLDSQGWPGGTPASLFSCCVICPQGLGCPFEQPEAGQNCSFHLQLPVTLRGIGRVPSESAKVLDFEGFAPSEALGQPIPESAHSRCLINR